MADINPNQRQKTSIKIAEKLEQDANYSKLNEYLENDPRFKQVYNDLDQGLASRYQKTHELNNQLRLNRNFLTLQENLRSRAEETYGINSSTYLDYIEGRIPDEKGQKLTLEERTRLDFRASRPEEYRRIVKPIAIDIFRQQNPDYFTPTNVGEQLKEDLNPEQLQKVQEEVSAIKEEEEGKEKENKRQVVFQSTNEQGQETVETELSPDITQDKRFVQIFEQSKKEVPKGLGEEIVVGTALSQFETQYPEEFKKYLFQEIQHAQTTQDLGSAPFIQQGEIPYNISSGSGPVDILRSELYGRAKDWFFDRVKSSFTKNAAKAAGKTAIQQTEKAAIATGAKSLAGLGAKYAATKATISAALGAATESLNAIVPGLGILIHALVIVAQFIKDLVFKLFNHIKQFIREHKDVVIGMAMVGAGVAASSPFFLMGGSFLMFYRYSPVARAIRFSAKIVVVVFAVITLLTIFIIMTIHMTNTGAYIVPQGGYGEQFGNLTGGDGTSYPPDIVNNCNPDETGEDITEDIARRITNGAVHLLPDNTGPRPLKLCIEPTLIVIHWSGGHSNNEGNDRTYETLISRNLACQLATDTNDQWVMQPFYENQVELSWCVGEWNIYAISNEMAGGAESEFTAPIPPPPEVEFNMAVQSTCVIMQQYNIPWTQIYGHYEVPNNGGKTDPGARFLHEAFIPAVRNRCG